jgi:Flp pilus assembly protein TadB
VAALELGEPAAMMSLYELVQDETADPAGRHAAAEALVRSGLLRRQRTGPSPMFIWLAGMTLVIVAAGAVSSLGAWAVLVFVVGALGLYALRRMGRRGAEGLYVGPKGEAIRVPRAGELG